MNPVLSVWWYQMSRETSEVKAWLNCLVQFFLKHVLIMYMYLKYVTVDAKGTILILKERKNTLFCSHVEWQWARNTDFDYPKFYVPKWFHEAFIALQNQKFINKATLKYISGCIQEKVAVKWEKFFYRSKCFLVIFFSFRLVKASSLLS